MGILTNAKGSIISEYFSLLTPYGRFHEYSTLEIILYRDHLIIAAPGYKNPLALPYSIITNVYYGSESEFVERGFGSIVGRAFVGKMLLGDVGALAGAVSGMGKKERKRYMLGISYKNATGGESFLKFEDGRLFKGVKLSQKLRALCGMPPQYGR